VKTQTHTKVTIGIGGYGFELSSRWWVFLFCSWALPSLRGSDDKKPWVWVWVLQEGGERYPWKIG